MAPNNNRRDDNRSRGVHFGGVSKRPWGRYALEITDPIFYHLPNGFLFLGQTLQNIQSIPSKIFPIFKSLSPRAISSDGQAKSTILVAEKLGEGGLELLRREANVDCSYNVSQEELFTKISLYDALIVTSSTKVIREVLESSSGGLKIVGRTGVGIENVDLQLATDFGCLFINAPTANIVAAAEHRIALIASMARNVPQDDASMKADLQGSGLSFFSLSCFLLMQEP